MGDLRAPGDYQRRIIDDELDELCAGAAAVAIEGAKAVGKTTTGCMRTDVAYLLEDPGVREVLAADPRRILEGGPVLIDEWQFLPQTWDIVRRAVDAGAPAGAFILTGSADATNPGTHSGAGRILKVRMRPLSLVERRLTSPTVSLADLLSGQRSAVEGHTTVRLQQYADEIVSSGFPGVRPLPDRIRRAQLRGYIDRVVDRDFPEMGREVRRPDTLRRWMAAYAAATSTTAAFETVRDAATSGHGDKPAKTTVQPYRETLERLHLIDDLEAWAPSNNHIHNLGASPKHHLADPALAASILGIGVDALLTGADSGLRIPRDGSFLGALFESLTTLSVRIYAQAAEARTKHFRTHGGDREVDLIVERDDRKVVALEVKLAATVSDDDVRHLLWLRDRIGDDLLDAAVITTGEDAYRRADGIAVIPAALLGP